jgi:hypothetical protein
MANLVQTEAQKWLEASLGGTAYTAVTSPKVALITGGTAPTATTAGSEVTGGSYARQGFTAGTATAATPSVISNTNVISFTGMPACTVESIEIYDNAGTRRLWFGALTTPKTVGAGDTVSFAASAISISLS